MTKKDFKEAMKRGLGRCIQELEHTDQVERYRDLVMWGCTHDLAYDAQCEGNRAWYLYELIKRFPDREPFLDAVIRKFSGNCSDGGWLFDHYCGILGYFLQDGEKKAYAALWEKYGELYQILTKKRKRKKNGTCPERDDFEKLCMELIDWAEDPLKIYTKVAEDIGNLFLNGSIFDAWSFQWLFEHCQYHYGKTNVKKILGSRPDSVAGVYLEHMLAWERKCAERRSGGSCDPKDTEEFLRIYEERTKPVPWIGRALERTGNREAACVLAKRYVAEQDRAERIRLLQIFTGRCHFPLSPEPLLKDARSEDPDLQNTALLALEHVRHEKVRQFVLELAEEDRIPEAVSILAYNYRPEDKETFVRLVKSIEITYEDGRWHGAFSSVLDLLRSKGLRNSPKELLPYMYEHTLCSFCREYIVREMGRRHMLTEEILEECLWDSNDGIRHYAGQCLDRRR